MRRAAVHVAELAHAERSAVPSRDLAAGLERARNHSLELARPLSAEDMTVQACADASPTKWHLAHTTWFFEQFLLREHLPGYALFDEAFNYCFNSYYESMGARQPRPKRGLMTRPSAEAVRSYRAHVDAALQKLCASGLDAGAAAIVELGINHEQQHQELMLTDILALFAAGPLRPAYSARRDHASLSAPSPMRWIAFEGGLVHAGSDGPAFCWDNERPRHRTFLEPFRLADRLVTNAEWLAFMADGGYATPSLWLSDGWARVSKGNWRAPLYWEEHDGAWQQMTLHGLARPEPAAPVCHVSYYEADAFARWAGARLPTELEWEMAASPLLLDDAKEQHLTPHPAPGASTSRLQQMFGEVWQWTGSAYLAYPGYRPPAGALGEYNGKFMCGQHVLRGSSCLTPAGHSRATYRNFFYPHQRWQMSGLRLASEA